MRKQTRKLRCPHCNGTNTNRHGYNILQDGSKRRRGYCRDCNRYFTLNRNKKNADFKELEKVVNTLLKGKFRVNKVESMHAFVISPIDDI